MEMAEYREQGPLATPGTTGSTGGRLMYKSHWSVANQLWQSASLACSQ